MALSIFSPRTRAWFEAAFPSPTPAQALAWPAIAGGEHVLLAAPTGSGKTLAAFLWGLDRLIADTEGAVADDRRQAGGVAIDGGTVTTGGMAADRGMATDGEIAAGGTIAGGAAVADRGRRHTRLVYVSPLKALSYDIERNLRVPLRGIGADRLRVGIRTGDTPQRERAAMARNPPDILITTPESLYLLLTSRAKAMLERVETVIVDEIHAVASTKRGAHLALTLERLEEQALKGSPGGRVQRIGLSATQRPLEEVGRYLVGPRRSVRIVDAGISKPLDLKIHVPVESMVEPGASAPQDPLAPVAGGEATRQSIWPAMYPELLALVRAHRSTIVFVNNRRGAERLALRLNELAIAQDGREVARAHHGSLAREERTVVEELLKAGELPCLVATSSLELGIDMGAVDLVLQVESPKSVARGLQRIGRSGHGVGDVSRGRIFPKFRADLLECAVLCRLMREGAIEETVVPRNALDVLAQQIVAIAASVEGEEAVSVDELYELVRRTHSYGELSRSLLENVLDMLDGRYPSQEFGELRARIVWDRLGGTIRARRGARQLAVSNAGTIPDRGLYAVTLPDGRRVGELDEEMVYEARPGQTFLLGASSWRIEEIGRDRVIVTPAPGTPGAVPFWKGDTVGRPKELGKAIGAFSRWAVDSDPETLARDYDLDRRAAVNLIEFLREQREATRVLPSDRTIVIERFRDEIGDWRLCVLSPYGGRIHAAWGLALSARIRERFGLESDAIWSDDGIVIHLPEVDGEGEVVDEKIVSGEDLVMIDPEEVEEAVVGELGASALFGARFRENAARALLIPRAYPGRRTPLWQQRLKAQSLLEVAKRYPDFPILLETYRECLRDVLDVGGLVELMRGLHTRELSLVEVQTQSASPFATSLLFDYVATYMYEGDAPNAERRAAALSLDRDLLRELLGQEELRDLIDAQALAEIEDDLQHRSERTRAGSPDELHDVLRRVGDLSGEEIAQRIRSREEGGSGQGWEEMVGELCRGRRAIALRIGGEERFVAADEAGLYRDAIGAAPPGGLPEAFLADVPGGLGTLVARYGRTHGPFTTAEACARWRVDVAAALAGLEREGVLVRGELRPGGSPVEAGSDGREWCDVDVLRRLRRASLAVLRKEIEPADGSTLASFMTSWQGVDRWAPGAGSASGGVDRLREVLVTLQGVALPVEIWESDVLARRVGRYSPAWLDELCASGEVVWVGAGASGRRSGRVAIYLREDAPLLGPPGGDSGGRRAAVAAAGDGRSGSAVDLIAAPGGAAPRAGVVDLDGVAVDATRQLIRERLAASPCFFTDLVAEIDVVGEALGEALWDLVWSGEVTNDAWAPLRARRLTGTAARAPARTARGTRRFAGRSRTVGRGNGRAPVQGRWSLTAGIFAAGTDGAVGPGDRRRALAELLLERYGVLTREQVVAERIVGGFSGLYGALCDLETLGVCRRGYFVEGLGAAQFALAGAVERLRSFRGDGLGGERDSARAMVIAAADPAQLYGSVLAWPRSPGPPRRLARVAGAHVVLLDGEAVLYVERGGRGLSRIGQDPSETVAGRGSERLVTALSALAEAVRGGRVGRLALERLDSRPIVGSEVEGLLVEIGFSAGPRRLTLAR